jgi:maltooligosyltrehalose trehalohydrolase
MKRVHAMPFGSELLTTGGVRFRLWAPTARLVTLLLGTGATAAEAPMRPVGDGWFELVAEAAGVGSRYRYRIDAGLCVPDPASRRNPDGVHGASEVIDPVAFDWLDDNWRGRPWTDAVIYEIHVGCFSPTGDFAGVTERLDYLADLGVTALELMPVADFPGRRNWGYDGVLAFAPARCYGHPDDFKTLVQEAHRRGLMVLLDVVYNHFGPEGNFLHAYAAPYFDTHRQTPWGAAISFDGPHSRAVRDFYIHNALYWLEEFHIDGLRLDAVHAIRDDSEPDILVELARAVRAGPGRSRRVHLVLENDNNAARYLRHVDGLPLYDAQWNDDFHHALHALLTGERDGYYGEFADFPISHLGRCLAEGFAWQGEASPWRRGAHRGEGTAELAPTAFVSFLQNHDQIGNRACGERIDTLAAAPALDAAAALRLLAPAPPLLFMGEEFAAAQPFLYFCDFGAELAAAVTRGRREEFSRHAGFADAASRNRIPDPNAEDTFRQCRLDWECLEREPHLGRAARYRELLALRRREIMPRLAGMPAAAAAWVPCGESALSIRWTLGDGAQLVLVANLGPLWAFGIVRPPGAPLYAVPAAAPAALESGRLPPWAIVWFLGAAGLAPQP